MRQLSGFPARPAPLRRKGCDKIERNGRVKGLTASAFNHIKGEQYGLSLGLVNYAWELHGVQIGLLNYARDLHGWQIGLLNYADNNPGWARLFPLFNREG